MASLITICQPGDEPQYAYPDLNDDLTFTLDPLDGPLPDPLYASQFEDGGTKAQDIKLEIYITRCRVLFYCKKYDKGGGWIGGGTALLLNAGSHALAAHRRKGKALAGHMRYEWLVAVGFTPKTGMLSDEKLFLKYRFPDEGVRTIEVVLPKKMDAGAIAEHIKNRAIAYRFASSEKFAAEEIAEFIELRDKGRLPDPEKNRIALYVMPTSFSIGGGKKHRPTQIPGDNVTPPSPSAEEPADTSGEPSGEKDAESADTTGRQATPATTTSRQVTPATTTSRQVTPATTTSRQVTPATTTGRSTQQATTATLGASTQQAAPVTPPAPGDPIAAEAANPATALARLAQIAQLHPEHRAAVAANPSCYPALRGWIAEQQAS